jgi:hypothetical protein
MVELFVKDSVVEKHVCPLAEEDSWTELAGYRGITLGIEPVDGLEFIAFGM